MIASFAMNLMFETNTSKTYSLHKKIAVRNYNFQDGLKKEQISLIKENHSLSAPRMEMRSHIRTIAEIPCCYICFCGKIILKLAPTPSSPIAIIEPL